MPPLAVDLKEILRLFDVLGGRSALTGTGVVFSSTSALALDSGTAIEGC